MIDKLRQIEWTSFYSASLKIAQRLGVSHAEAERMLRVACAEGRIHSRREHREEEELPPYKWTRIAPADWRDYEIDYEGSDADGDLISVDVNEHDFDYWLDQQAKPSAEASLAEARVPALLASLASKGQENAELRELFRISNEAHTAAEHKLLEAKGRCAAKNEEIARLKAERDCKATGSFLTMSRIEAIAAEMAGVARATADDMSQAYQDTAALHGKPEQAASCDDIETCGSIIATAILAYAAKMGGRDER